MMQTLIALGVVLSLASGTETSHDRPVLIVVSCIEEAMEAVPCLIYELRPEVPNPVEVGVVEPADGIRMVKLCEDERVVAIWRYTAGRSASPPDGAGEMYLASLDRLSTARVFAMPFRPVVGGYFLMQGDDGFGLVTRGITGHDPIISFWTTGLSTSVPWEGVPWGRVYLNGTSVSGGQRAEFFGLAVAGDTGKFTCLLGVFSMPMSIGFDEQALAYYNAITQHGALSPKDLPHTGNVVLSINNPRRMFLGVRLPKSLDSGTTERYGLYDKDSRRWVWVRLPEIDAPKNITKASKLMFEMGGWLVRQCIYGEPDVDHIPAGKTLFCDYTGKVYGEWEMRENTELLAIDGKWMAFRREDAIYVAPFDNGKVGEEMLLCKDERLADVHWGLFRRDSQKVEQGVEGISK